VKIHLVVVSSLLFFAGPALAGASVPIASGEIVYKEKLKIGSGCDSFSTIAVMDVTLYSTTWTAVAPAGTFDGPLQSAGKPGVYNLQFGPASLSAYRAYLEDVASDLCGTAVSIPSVQTEIQVKLGKGGKTSMSLRGSGVGTSAFGSAQGSHQLKGKGVLELPN
jgi:hypothetical protein